MDFLQQLNELSCEASEQRHAEQELAAEALMEKFQQECLLAARKGETESRCVSDDLFFLNNKGNFSNGWERKPKFQDEFVTLLQNKLRATFGPDSQVSVALHGPTEALGMRWGILLAATWPEATHRAVPHYSSHALRSNLSSQCPVCLCGAEVVALTPCGHVLCVSCSTNFHRGTTCPVCREPVAGRQNLFS
ncbi:unnamed protein product [Polarella glacialis]|uniref:RING-type domain-containing protein n=1 Tax=Polarella glacialis TaxID=89957 RepID=A0A813DWF5_POLGL|nr:unnamed protein product [Polarella glacialis]